MTAAQPRATRGLLAALLLAAPVVVGLAYSLLASLGVAGVAADGLSLVRLARVLRDGETWRAVGWSVTTAAVATALATCGAAGVALGLRRRTRWTWVADRLATAPLPIPHLVAAAAGWLILAQSGLLARALYALGVIDAPGSMPAMVLDRFGVGFTLTLAWKEMPFLIIVASTLLASRGSVLEETARTLGASARATVWRVTLPVLLRGMLPAVVAAFIFVFGSFEAAAILGPSDPLPLPVMIQERYADLNLARRSDAHVLTLLALLAGLVMVAVHERVRALTERDAQ